MVVLRGIMVQRRECFMYLWVITEGCMGRNPGLGWALKTCMIQVDGGKTGRYSRQGQLHE